MVHAVAPWVIVGGPRAMYLNSNYGGAATSDLAVMDLMITELEPLLFKHRVNVGCCGHNRVGTMLGAGLGARRH